MKTVVVVTGATSGVGREFVRQLDGMLYGEVDEVWAVARCAEGLMGLAGQTHAPLRAFPCDLTRPDGVQLMEEALAQEQATQGICVKWLVNSAGCGWFGNYQDMDRKTVRRMVELNCLALADMTSAALPHMLPGSRIVNMSSVAAYMPLPGMALYSATKRFVLDLTRALNEDLRGTGISACAVCPKAMRTAFWDEAGERRDRDMGFFFGTEPVDTMVHRALRAARAGRGSIVTSPDMKLACAAFKALPYGLTCAAAKAGLAVRRAVEDRRG